MSNDAEIPIRFVPCSEISPLLDRLSPLYLKQGRLAL